MEYNDGFIQIPQKNALKTAGKIITLCILKIILNVLLCFTIDIKKIFTTKRYKPFSFSE